MVAVRRKDLKAAERDFREATRLGGESPELLELQGMGYYYLGCVLRDPENREKALGRAISRLSRYNSLLERSHAPRDAESYFVIAKSYLKLGDRTDLSRATTAFAQAERAGLKTVI